MPAKKKSRARKDYTLRAYDSNEVPLRNHAVQALNSYFTSLNGHRPAQLYELVLREVEEPLFKAVLELEREGADVDFESLNSKTEGDEFAARMIPLVLMNSSLHGSNEHYVAEECVSTFRRMKLEQRIEELKRELAIAEREQDTERVSKLSAEQIQLSAQRQGMLQPQSEAASRIR